MCIRDRVYTIKEQHDKFLRGDIFVGTTSHMQLVNDYLHAEGELEEMCIRDRNSPWPNSTSPR